MPITARNEQARLVATYSAPSGRSPNVGGGGAPDIEVSTYEVISFDPRVKVRQRGDWFVLDLDALFPEMTSVLGTRFVDGALLEETATDAVIVDGAVVLHRQPPPCVGSAMDTNDATFSAAMLGENGHKYRVNFALTFDQRQPDEAGACLSSGEAAEFRGEVPAAAPATASSSPSPASGETAEASPSPSSTDSGEQAGSDAWLLWVVLGGSALVLMMLVAVRAATRKRAAVHGDGSRDNLGFPKEGTSTRGGGPYGG